MIKSFIASILGLSFVAGSAVAQVPTMTGISSGTTVQDFRSVSRTESQVWGDFSEVGVSVNAAVAGTYALDLSNLDVLVDLSAGGTAGLNYFELDGGFYDVTNTTTRVTGRSVTSSTNFN